MITNLKVHNAKLEEKSRVDQSKYKKIDSYYQN
jgi:hypothetical protein